MRVVEGGLDISLGLLGELLLKGEVPGKLDGHKHGCPQENAVLPHIKVGDGHLNTFLGRGSP